MVKVLRILLVTVVLRVQGFASGFQNVIIVNNKQMTYDRKGELVEIDKVKTGKPVKPVEITEKSNIFKNSVFVTKSKFQGASNDFKSGLITKHTLAQNRVPPSRYKLTTRQPFRSSTSLPPFPSISFFTSTPGYSTIASINLNEDFTIQNHWPIQETTTRKPYRRPLVTTNIYLNDETSTRKPYRKPPAFTTPTYDTTRKPYRKPPALSIVYDSSTKRPSLTTDIHLINETTRKPPRIAPVKNIPNLPSTPKPPIVSTFFFNDDLTPIKNSLLTTYEDIFKNDFVQNDFQKYPPVTIKPKPIESTYEKPFISVYTTPSPTTEITINLPVSKKPKKKKTKKKTTKTTTQLPVQDHIIQNLDFYRKVLAPNCTKNETEVKENVETTTEEIVVKITPRPPKKIVKDVSSEDTSGEETSSDDDDLERKKKGKKKKKKKKKCKKKKKSAKGHHVHHYHKIGAKHRKGSHSKEEVIYYDPPLVGQLDKAGNLFNTFYSFFEDALTSREFLDYGKSNSYGDSYDYDDYGVDYLRRRRRSVDQKLKKRKPRKKSLKTKITVTSEYDDSVAGQTTPLYPTYVNTTKRPRAKPNKQNSEESEESEESLFDEIMDFRDDFDDSGDIDDDVNYSDEYFEEPATNRLPEGEEINYESEENVASGSIFDTVTGFFSSVGNFLSSFVGPDDTGRKPPKHLDYEYDDDDYEDEGRSTTEKVERQSKRPKRENDPLPWYQPSFLFSNNQNDEAFSSTTQRNWLETQHIDDKNDFTIEIPALPEAEALASTTDAPSFNLLEMVSKYLLPKKKKLSTFKTKQKLKRKNYDGYQLWRLIANSKDERNNVESFKMSDEGTKVHWLKGPSLKGFIDVVVPPDYTEQFKDFLSDSEIKHEVKIRDIQYAIQYENPRLNKRDQIELEVIYGHPLTWYRYHPYKDIQAYFDFLKRKFPKFVKLLQIGWSFEGRPLTVVKISYPQEEESSRLPREPRKSPKKPAIFIQSGAEAHEWLSIACSTYILNNLIFNIERNDTFGDMIRETDWYLMPVLNPDGYDYSMKYDRLWQKTRSKHFPQAGFWSSAISWFRSPENKSEDCLGVDVNRNFEINWMKKGASTDECSDFYSGPYASSEPEAKFLSNFLMNPKRNIDMFISLSGYGQKISFPFQEMSPENLDFIYDVARAGLRNLKSPRMNSANFTIDARRKKSGSIDLFAMRKANIRYSYTLEVRDDPRYGFFMPATTIEENAQEIFDIITGMIVSFA